jgi:hypothetical protein
VHPQFGLGGGSLTLGNQGGGAFQLDFIVGAEREGEVGARGFLFKSDVLLASGGDSTIEFRAARLDVSALATLSTKTKELGRPFARLGMGPSLTSAWVNERDAVYGIGVQVEAAAGFKNATELYIDTRATVDAFGSSFGMTGGVRVHAIVLLYILDGLS